MQLRRAQREAQVLHGGNAVFFHLPGIETGADAFAADLHAHILVESNQAVQFGAHLAGFANLDEERGRERALGGQQFVVDIEFPLHPRGVADAFDPAHFQHLPAQRFAVLEEQRGAISHRHAARGLVGDHPLLQFAAGRGEDGGRRNVGQGEGPHSAEIP